MVEFITQHGDLLLEVLGGIMVIAFAVARITTNNIDNKVLRKVMKVINALGLNIKGIEEVAVKEHEEKNKGKK